MPLARLCRTLLITFDWDVSDTQEGLEIKGLCLTFACFPAYIFCNHSDLFSGLSVTYKMTNYSSFPISHSFDKISFPPVLYLGNM